ncbi:MAG: hypothetical protein ACRC5M_02585 [Anaeroplasmataceae bacterium]
MKDLIKGIENLPMLVKLIFTLLFGFLTNFYRLFRSIDKQNFIGILLSILLIIFGGFIILWIVDIITIVLGNDIWWID